MENVNTKLMPADLRPGDVVSIPIGYGLRHYGVVTLAGAVISRSSRHGGVVTQTIEAFADGRRIRRHRAFSNRHVFEIEARARRHIGADYDLLQGNCVHHVRWVHGRQPTMIQRLAGTLEALGDMLGPARRR